MVTILSKLARHPGQGRGTHFRLKYFYSILSCVLLWSNTWSQSLKFSPDSSSIFARQVTGNLPEASVYFIGQLHNNAANTILEKELLFSLHSLYGVTYDILEYSHSAAVILNEYLATGEDSLLSYINQEAEFRFIKSVKQFNDTVRQNGQIKFYGIDFEGRHGGKFTRKAISVILKHRKANDLALINLLKACALSDSTILGANLKKVKIYLETNIDSAKAILGDDYLDVLLITNAQYGFSSKRDVAMYQNFKLLYKELSQQSSSKPRFFGSFGIGHINPRNGKGIAAVLNSAEDSPVKNEVGVIGIQYINCQFNQGNTKPSEGILNFLCKEARLEKLMKGVMNEKATFQYIPVPGNTYDFCNAGIKELKGMIIVENFKASVNWTWE